MRRIERRQNAKIGITSTIILEFSINHIKLTTMGFFDTNNVFLAEITGDWKAWNFVINNAQGQQIGQITKKWAGLAQEMFTTADKYNVTLTEYNMSPEHKIAVLASAITIDMVLKESK
jgi:uncharacterized protein YxjI